MRNKYILTFLAILFCGVANAQIVQVTDINATGDAGIGYPTLFNGEIFFEADDGSEIGDELYKIAADGSVVLVKDINTDAADGSPIGDPKHFIEYKGMLYFSGNDGDNGADKHDTELWRTDGTTEGTIMVEDIWPGGIGNASNPQEFFVFNDKLYFNGKVDAANQVFRYDGTNPVVKVTNWRDDGLAVPFFPTVDEANGKAYLKINIGKFQLGVINADETFFLDTVNKTGDHGFAGTEAGIIYKGKFYFNGDNGTSGDELFVSDGTQGGATLLKDIHDGGDSDPEQFTIWNDELYFIAGVATGMQLWKTDGTEAGTVMVAEPFPGGDADMDHLTLFNDKLYFAATDGVNGVEVWSFDGTTANMVKNLDGDVADSNPEGFTEVDGLLFFAADDAAVNGERLYVTDGTENGTLPVDSLFLDTAIPEDVNYAEFVVHGTKLYFTGDDANGDEIFMVDAKSIREAMAQVTDINKSGDSGIGELIAYNGEVFFEADDGVIGDELYKIAADGSVVLVKDINTDTEDNSPIGDPKNFIIYKGELYFNGNDGDNGADKHDSELWKTDGTTDGTVLVDDIWPGGDGNGSNPQQMFVFNDKLYFNAKVDAANQVFRYDGTNPVVKVTNWRDDGLAVPFFPTVDEANGKAYLKINIGKFQLGVINADETFFLDTVNKMNDHGFAGTEAGIIYKGKFYFNGDNGTSGDELFVSDGTQGGATLLKDIHDGGDSDPEQFTIYNDELYFIAEVATGMQLWKTDGTEAGTVMVAEPNPGADGDMDNLAVYDGKLYFAATDGVNGVELWAYDGTTAAMLKDLDGTTGDSDPEGFIEVDGLLLFVASDGTNDVLWVTNGTAEYTMTAAEALNSTFQPVKVSASERAVVGTTLYYSADDANGYDDIYSVDVNKIWSEDVTFTVSDENGPLEGATVAFDGTTATTDAAGMVTFPYVRMGADQAYTVTLSGYEEAAGTVTVADAAVAEQVVLIALPMYNVTFNVTDGTNPIDGAEIAFNAATSNTDAAGAATFTGVMPAADMAYTITKAGYTEVSGTVSVVDADVTVNETMTLIVYTVTFNVTDGTNALEGATVNFNSQDKVTESSGTVIFSDVVPGTGQAYTVSLDFRFVDATGTVDVDGDETVDVVLQPSSVNNAMQNAINVYPNPTRGMVHIDGLNDSAVYEIYNISQQKIAEGVIENASIQLDRTPGLYILKITSGEQTTVQKVIVE